MDYEYIIRAVFSVQPKMWVEKIELHQAISRLERAGVATNDAALAAYQTLGAYVLDVLWTELCVRGGLCAAKVAYMVVMNDQYALTRKPNGKVMLT